MADQSWHKASDLPHDERVVVERWLGRPLLNDETIRVNAYRPHSAPVGDDHVWDEIMSQAREIGSRVPDADEASIDALVDEAFKAVRGSRR